MMVLKREQEPRPAGSAHCMFIFTFVWILMLTLTLPLHFATSLLFSLTLRKSYQAPHLLINCYPASLLHLTALT